MTSEPLPPVPPSMTTAEVGYGEQIAQGGSSTVFSLLGARKQLLYKRYNEPRSRSGIERLVHDYVEPGFDEAYVREHLAWPVAAVCSGDDIVGVLVIRAGAAFHFELPSGRMRVRDLNYLLYEKRAQKLGVARATDRQKVELLGKLTAVLSWLDERGLVHEDLAAHNVLWSLRPLAVFVLDCDSVRTVAAAGDQPLYTTMDWTDPRVLAAEVPRPDRASTSYVLGLLAARLLISPYWHAGDVLPTDSFPVALSSLVVRATSGTAADRPSMAEWVRAVKAALPQTAGAVAELDVGAEADPRTVRRRDRSSFLIGLVLGAAVAVAVLVRFV